MDTTNLPDEREVDNVADHFIIVLAGLELLGQVTDTIVDWDDTIREFLTESIVHAATESTEGVCDFEVTDEVRTVALDVLTATDELYEEDPLQGWIRQCSKISGRYHNAWDEYQRQNVQIVGFEIQLPWHKDVVKVFLVIGGSNDNAELIVSNGLEATIRIVHCPAIIKRANNEAEFC